MKYTLDESREWYNALPAKRSAAAMIIRRDTTVLMVKDDYKDAMTFPGGVIDPGESPRAAAIRETEEETTIQLSEAAVQFFTVAYVPPVNDFLDRYQFFFVADISDDTQMAAQTVAGIEYDRWVPIEGIGQKAGGRPTYAAIQHMLQTKNTIPYFEAQRKGDAPWQT